MIRKQKPVLVGTNKASRRSNNLLLAYRRRTSSLFDCCSSVDCGDRSSATNQRTRMREEARRPSRISPFSERQKDLNGQIFLRTGLASCHTPAELTRSSSGSPSPFLCSTPRYAKELLDQATLSSMDGSITMVLIFDTQVHRLHILRMRLR